MLPPAALSKGPPALSPAGRTIHRSARARGVELRKLIGRPNGGTAERRARLAAHASSPERCDTSATRQRHVSTAESAGDSECGRDTADVAGVARSDEAAAPALPHHHEPHRQACLLELIKAGISSSSGINYATRLVMLGQGGRCGLVASVDSRNICGISSAAPWVSRTLGTAA
eukprot:1848068-Pyramimonas_sp.AAC.1